MRWNDLKHSYADRIKEVAKLSPHELLGVNQHASEKDIKVAYLRLVRAYHPDRSDPFMVQHNQEMIKLINAAYDKLRTGS